MCKGIIINLFFSFIFSQLLNVEIEINNHFNLTFLVHPNTRIEITKFIPIQGEIGMETK